MIHLKKQCFKIGATLFLIGIFFFQGLSANNVLKIGHYEVLPKTDMVIQLEAENSDLFVAFQTDIPIPTGFSYVDGSAQLNASRISGHLLNASLINGNVLRLIGFSLSNIAFTGNTGSLVSFKFKSGTVPATFQLLINQPLLGNSQSTNILTSSTNGDVTVLAPNLKLSINGLNYGRIPLESSSEKSFQITNEGNRDLIINSLNFNDAQFSSPDIAGFTMGANSSRTISVKFMPLAKGTFARQLQINSNDPDQPISAVTLNAVAYAVNEIHTGNITGASSSTGKLEFTMNNMEAFTGFQFDLTLPQPMTFASGTAELFRLVDHNATVNQINAHTLRVLVFSASNKNFTGNDGKVISLDFLLNGVAGNYSIDISNVIIANTLGENIVSASTGGQLQISSPDIDGPTHLNFGDVSILSRSTLQHRIFNYGQDPLVVSLLMFSNDYFKSAQTVPFTIQPSGYFDLPVEFANTVKGLTTGTLRILSNDPDENPFTIQLTGNAFTPNYLLINPVTFSQGESKNVAVEIENEEPFVAFQFDLSHPAGFTPDLNNITLTSRKQDHVLAAVALSTTSLRIIVYSVGQKAFSGKSGPVLNIPFKAETTLLSGTYDLSFSNSMMSNIKSENVLYSSKNGTLNVNMGDKTLNLSSVLFEGLYNKAMPGTMRRANNELGPVFPDPLVSDQITVELHDASNYGNIVHTALAVNLSTTGSATVTIPAAFNASYFITIKHRNSVETTTATAILFAGSTINQSFGTPSDVFGGNLALSADARYLIFAGDVNQDGVVDTRDYINVDNDSFNFASGYLSTDVDGNGVIDTRDFISIDNNNYSFIGTMHP